MEEYTDIQGASKLLGEAPGKIYYYADKGTIRIEPGHEGRRTRRYSVADILALKERIQARTKRAIERRPRPASPLIDWLYAADVPAGLKLSQQLYSEEVDLAEAAVYQSWRKNNPYLTMAAFSPDRSECYASVQVVPLVNEQIILDVLSNRREEASIRPEEIRGYDQSGPYTLLVTSATCLPDRPHLLYAVLHKYMEYWIEMFPERYIQRLYAQATESGMRIVQHFFLAPRPDLAYNAFMLDLQWPPTARMIKTFKHRMEEKAPLPPDLQWPPIMPEKPATVLAPIKTQRSTVWSQERITAAETVSSDMPDGLIGWREYARQVGVPEKDVLREIRAGRIVPVPGAWKVGRAIVREALDEVGRGKVDRLNQSMDPLFPAGDIAPGERE